MLWRISHAGKINRQWQICLYKYAEFDKCRLIQARTRLEDRGKWEKLADTVVCLREPFDTPQDAAVATHGEVRKAVSIAGGCLGGHWDLPLTMMLLALKPRQTNDPVITGGIMALFAGMCQLTCRRSISFFIIRRKRD